MQSKKLSGNKSAPATQRYLDIAEIRDDMVILKDGTVRSLLLVSSINFALKSTDEQEATISAYTTFLNGLEYPIQIVIQSRSMNIDGYMNRLAEQQKKTTNELLRNQIIDYRSFVQELVELGQIMEKRFYVVIPYDPISNRQKKFFSRLSEALSPAYAAKLSQKQLMERIDQLNRRVSIIQGQLSSMGLNSVRLDTQGLIQVYYETYNPDLFDTERLGDMSQIRHE